VSPAALADRALAADWRRVDAGCDGVSVAERDVIGTTARVVVWPNELLSGVLAAVDREIDQLDRQASRFREDSQLSRLTLAGEGVFLISDELAEAIGVALAAARWTDGLVDPTVGAAVIAAGYDRDFRDVAADAASAPERPELGPGWRSVALHGRLLGMPAGVQLDLGATAKALGADRAVASGLATMGGSGGLLVSLGGDIAVGGVSPVGGWPIVASDDQPAGDPELGREVRLAFGAVATSSTTRRQWRRAGKVLHHLIDPRSGAPADSPWRTASVVAASCVDANAASTAAIVGGYDAEEWLRANGMSARLVAHDGTVQLVGGWPAQRGGTLTPPAGTRCRVAPPTLPALELGDRT
jgi:thiamine biosynthesis lipoprotein